MIFLPPLCGIEAQMRAYKAQKQAYRTYHMSTIIARDVQSRNENSREGM